jgi:hypothetical protein
MMHIFGFNAAHCVATGCDTWTFHPVEHDFLFLIWGDEELVFCSPDHLLITVAERSTPIEEIPA